MAQPADVPTLDGARQKVLTTIKEIEDFTRQRLMAGGLNMATQMEARALQKHLTHRLWLLKSLWYAEPVRLTGLGNWINNVADEMTAKLGGIEVFTRVRKTMILTGPREYRQLLTPLVAL